MVRFVNISVWGILCTLVKARGIDIPAVPWALLRWPDPARPSPIHSLASPTWGVGLWAWSSRWLAKSSPSQLWRAQTARVAPASTATPSSSPPGSPILPAVWPVVSGLVGLARIRWRWRRRRMFAFGRYLHTGRVLFACRKGRGLFGMSVSLGFRIEPGRANSTGRADWVVLPALFRMSEKSFRVALLGSTPKEREKSLVARSITKRLALGFSCQYCKVSCVFW